MPELLKDGVLYVSMSFAAAAHRCACGCGREVFTPLSPTDWQLLFDGRNISLKPSIGNWSYPCRSHYWIRNGVVCWAADMSQRMVEQGRARDREKKAKYYASQRVLGLTGVQKVHAPATVGQKEVVPVPWWRKLLRTYGYGAD
ncbi:MAG: DUF6527 family protein [Perlucidibaca sp.]